MSEVLSLIYSASGPSIVVGVDRMQTIKGRNVVIAGGLPLERHLTLAELRLRDEDLCDDLESVLARLEPIARELAEGDEADPRKIRQEANALAADRQALEREKLAHREAIEAARAELAALTTAKGEAAKPV